MASQLGSVGFVTRGCSGLSAFGMTPTAIMPAAARKISGKGKLCAPRNQTHRLIAAAALAAAALAAAGLFGSLPYHGSVAGRPRRADACTTTWRWWTTTSDICRIRDHL